MKTVYNKAEGITMNASLDFGSCDSITHEFEYLMDTSETMWDVNMTYFYRVTDDKYIQLAFKMNGGSLRISAQFKLLFQNLKANIIFIVKEHIEAHLPYHGFPTFQKSVVFSEQEFNRIIQTMSDEKRAIIALAKAKETPIIQYLKAQGVTCEPSGNNPNSWQANCPCGSQHFIMIVTTEDTWGCGYCKRKGKLPELKKWIQELQIKKDQN